MFVNPQNKILNLIILLWMVYGIIKVIPNVFSKRKSPFIDSIWSDKVVPNLLEERVLLYGAMKLY